MLGHNILEGENQDRVIFKIDFEKAYDKVNWSDGRIGGIVSRLVDGGLVNYTTLVKPRIRAQEKYCHARLSQIRLFQGTLLIIYLDEIGYLSLQLSIESISDSLV
ncbi:hypothetical protein ACJX0J_023799 [Zea mays]